MKYLHPTIAVSDDGMITEETLKRRLMHADVCISDLDHTDTIGSPAKDIAIRRIGVSSTKLGLAKFLNWIFWTGMELLTAQQGSYNQKVIERVKEQRWEKYEKLFLRKKETDYQRSDTFLKDEVLQELKPLLNQQHIADSLYDETRLFYHHLPAKKIYLSRNIYPIVKAYADYLHFDAFNFDVKNKDLALHRLILRNSSWKRMVLRIDGAAEDEMVFTAKSYQNKGRLEDVLVLKRSPEMEGNFNNCDVLLGSNDSGLVQIMTK